MEKKIKIKKLEFRYIDFGEYSGEYCKLPYLSEDKTHICCKYFGEKEYFPRTDVYKNLLKLKLKWLLRGVILKESDESKKLAMSNYEDYRT